MSATQIPQDHPIIMFDGVCKFCHASVQFVIKRDQHRIFLFCPIQSNKGHQLMQQYGVTHSGLTSMILLEKGKVYRKSTAGLRIARGLRMPWPLLYGFILVPAILRDTIYDFIGNHRYKWFGKFDQCWIPDDETRNRFLE